MTELSEEVEAIEAIDVIEATEETEIETIAENLTARESAEGADRRAITVLEENMTIRTRRAVPTEIERDKNATPTAATNPSGTVIEVQEEEMVTDLRDGISSTIAGVAEVDIEIAIRTAV